MQTPKFWHKRGFWFEILQPFTLLYALFFALKKRFTKPSSFAAPLLCVGNITAGGAGKTPTAIALFHLLKHDFPNAMFVSRGYGGQQKNPLLVDRATHTASLVGDEPLLLARHAPCWVARSRKKAIAAAIAAGADLIIMDDGLQHFAVARDVNIIVVDGGFSFGNYGLLPSGPLREKIASAVKRSHAVLWIGKTSSDEARLQPLPVFKGKIIATEPIPDQTIPYLAFAGLARPAKFFDTLASLGYSVQKTIAFPDHHYYSEAELKTLASSAKSLGATLLTTEKDFVRLPKAWRTEVSTLPVSISISEAGQLHTLLLSILRSKKPT